MELGRNLYQELKRSHMNFNYDEETVFSQKCAALSLPFSLFLRGLKMSASRGSPGKPSATLPVSPLHGEEGRSLSGRLTASTNPLPVATLT